MQSRIIRGQTRIYDENISYYDAIAGNYDNNLARENSNKIVRNKVSEKFHEIVKQGDVLDFGGGTGQDLEWLSKNGYRVFFCEPSRKMRDKAIELNNDKLHDPHIIFIDQRKVDFTNWGSELPFSQKVDAILANFAVTNLIPDIELLFQNLSLVIKPGGHLFELILHKRYHRTLRSWLYQECKSLLLRRPDHFQVQFLGQTQTVWIYSTREIKRTSAPYFYFNSIMDFKKYGFSLVHLIKK